MGDEKERQETQEPPRKLCSNCAYREHCKKRFSANVVNGQVICNEYALDIGISRKAED